jgi:polyisoprenyl-phosphate glycosyltransferase
MSGNNVVVLMATYNDWDSIVELLPKIDDELIAINATGHIVIVDDGSSDFGGQELIGSQSFLAIKQVECVELFRNQGNQRANAVGIAYCEAETDGDYLVVMDSDQEDKPNYISQLIKTCAENQNKSIIFAERAERSEGVVFRFFYGVYQRLYKLLTGMNISIGNYSVIPKLLIPRVANIAELWSHYPAAIMRARIPFFAIHSERGKRTRGKSKMSIVPLLLHALSGFTVHAETIGARALVMALGLGTVILLIVGLFLGMRMFTDIPILGWTSQIITLLMIVVFQIIITAAIMVFMVISIRMQVPMIPALEHKKFIFARRILFPQTIKKN